MKKILTVLLLCGCLFAMFACGDESASVADFSNAMKNTNPTVVNVTVTMNSPLGALNSTYKTTYAEDGSFVLDYTKEEFNTATSGAADETKKVISGSVTCDKDGNYSDGGAIVGTVTAAAGTTLNLAEKKLDAEFSEDGNVLTATVKAKNTKSVFGVEYTGDVTLVITRSADKVVSYTMTYAIDENNSVTVVCSYQ